MESCVSLCDATVWCVARNLLYTMHHRRHCAVLCIHATILAVAWCIRCRLCPKTNVSPASASVGPSRTQAESCPARNYDPDPISYPIILTENPHPRLQASPCAMSKSLLPCPPWQRWRQIRDHVKGGILAGEVADEAHAGGQRARQVPASQNHWRLTENQLFDPNV